jgi:hypothetical protein
MLKLEYLDLENLYGYPALSPTFLKWAKSAGNVQVVIAVHNLRALKRAKEFVIVVAGLPFLESSGVPILGYQRNDNGVWTKSSLAVKLTPNKVQVLLPKVQQEPAGTKALYEFYVNNVMSDEFSSRFKTFQTRECLNDRVFQHKRKT